MPVFVVFFIMSYVGMLCYIKIGAVINAAPSDIIDEMIVWALRVLTPRTLRYLIY